jgi:hypothetical protein
LSVPGAHRRGGKPAEGQGPAVVTSGGGIPGREAASPGAAIPANVLAGFFRLARFAGYVGVLAIIVLSLVPGQWRPSTGLPKALEHGLAYWIAAGVLMMAGRARWPQMLLLIVLAGVLEVGQAWVPGRDSNPTDFLASSAGALLGFGLSSLVLARMSRLSGK